MVRDCGGLSWFTRKTEILFVYVRDRAQKNQLSLGAVSPDKDKWQDPVVPAWGGTALPGAAPVQEHSSHTRGHREKKPK